MSSLAVARRYAAALADVVGSGEEAREVLAELDAWAKMINSSQLFKDVLNNPTIPYDQKQRVLNQLIERSRVRQTTANFLRVLLRNQRLAELATINERFARIIDERAGLVSAEVTSAGPVPDAAKNTIRQRLRDLTGRDVRIDFQTNGELIGGIVTRIGSTIYDGSIKNQLEELGKQLSGN